MRGLSRLHSTQLGETAGNNPCRWLRPASDGTATPPPRRSFKPDEAGPSHQPAPSDRAQARSAWRGTRAEHIQIRRQQHTGQLQPVPLSRAAAEDGSRKSMCYDGATRIEFVFRAARCGTSADSITVKNYASQFWQPSHPHAALPHNPLSNCRYPGMKL